VAAEREEVRTAWLEQELGHSYTITPLAGDASFRRYFRITHAGQAYVLMDAPPPHEDVGPFLAVRDWFEQSGLRVSACYAQDTTQGFLLLEDFGNRLWSTCNEEGVELSPLFNDALRQLHLLQASKPAIALPQFDVQRMQRECELYLDWYLPHVAGYVPTETERTEFHHALSGILTKIAGLPQVPVHLDYHSRNLMLPNGSLPLGLIDYQDAVSGPVTYDLASLLYDCYQDYPEAERLIWSQRFYESLPVAHTDFFADTLDWHNNVRLTALQRHIKAIGIFGRLAHRDGKQQFLGEIPLTRKHLEEEMRALGMDKTRFPLLYIKPAHP